MRRFMLIVCVVMFSGFCVFSQSFKGDLGAGITMTSGNTESSSYSLTYKGEKTFSKSKQWISSANYLKKEDDSVTTADSLELQNKFEWKHSEKMFSFYELGYLRDEFKDYAYRLTPGLGIGYHLVKNDRHNLKLNGGISEVIIKYDLSNDTDSFAALTMGNSYEWKMSENASFTQSMKYSMDMSDNEKYFVDFEMNLTVMINTSWGTKLTLLNKYDNMPSNPDLKKNDMTFIAGLTYKIGN